MTSNTQLLIIGAGPGGYTAAFLAADLGMDVTLVDPSPHLGGVCLHHGCIPSKTLLHATNIISESKEAEAFGITFDKTHIDLDKLRHWKNSVTTKLANGLNHLCKQRKIHTIQGKATFENSNTVCIHRPDESKEKLTFEKAILATGSSPVRLPNIPDSTRILNSTTALNLENIPKSLLIVGGGYIGLELGSVYAGLGSDVSVVEMTDGLLPGVDRDLVRPLERRLKRILKKTSLNTKVTHIEETNQGLLVTSENAKGKSDSQEYEKVLIAIGRKPNTADMGLENTNIKLDKRGFVKVTTQRQTADSAIFAIGDITGEPMLAHKAAHEGRTAVETLHGKNTSFEPKAIPAVVFTDPEIATCGLTENQATKENRAVKIAKFPWAASGRALTLNRNEGVTKLIIDPESQKILGVGIVGPGAGELIAEGVLAIEMGTTADQLQSIIHPHPTLSETLMESAEAFLGQSTHIFRPKK